MIRISRPFALAAFAVMLTAGASFAASASGQEKEQVQIGPGALLDDAADGEKEDMENIEKAVLVMGTGGSNVKVSYYEKDESGVWNAVFSTDGVFGRNGGTYEKAEGDGKTPFGVFRINKAFGILDDPGCILPYTKLTDDDYWVDDPASSHYNRMVDAGEVEKDWDSAEHLIQVAPYYNYVLSLDYNEEAVPGKGSAIFIHCTAPGYTGSSGCICIGEEEMKTLMVRADESMRAVVVPDKEALDKLQEKDM